METVTQPVPCPTCGRSLPLPDDAGGRIVRCPDCQGRARVLDAGGVLNLEPMDEQEQAPAPRAPGARRPARSGEARRRRTVKRSKGSTRNYLMLSIVATLFCCQPAGIVALIFAVLAGTARRDGDWERAAQHNKQASLWLKISVGAWFVVVLIYAVIFLVGAGA